MALTMALLCSFAFNVLAASFPPLLEGITIVNSTHFPGRSISYKETTICETTDGVKSYSGYVSLPANSADGQQAPIHIYFWFFEARNNSKEAPLSLWLQGGPGVPSITAALVENGPCSVASDSRSTFSNQWSWNDKVNMLYVDQPVQVGFSYNSLVNGTINEIPTPFVFEPANFSANAIPDTNLTYLTGTFAAPGLTAAPNTTLAAAPAMWAFMQTWMQDFPEYKPASNKISIWTESYGGHYAPVFSSYFEEQNDLLASDSATPKDIPIHVDTIGLVNACIDIDTQMPFYPEFAFNNTYGIQAINRTQYQHALASSSTCRNMTSTCRTIADEQDPQGYGNNTAVNTACLDAYLYCFSNMHDGYSPAKNLFDITSPALESFPPKWAAGYLNSAEVQQALGVPLNFTGNSMVVASVFNLTGDFVRGHGLANLGTLMDRGVKVALVYGDRDYQCNWLGGEAISLAIKANSTTGFANAGYANIQTNESYVGGLVRQQGNLTFSRVFQAGHEVPAYQPETAYQIFNRVMFNMDVATGKEHTTSNLSTTGPNSAFTKSEVPPIEAQALCYLWDILETCSTAQKQILQNGSAIVENFILVGQTQANGSAIYFNGTSGGGSGSSTPSNSGSGSPTSDSAQRYAANGYIWIASMSMVILVGLGLV